MNARELGHTVGPADACSNDRDLEARLSDREIVQGSIAKAILPVLPQGRELRLGDSPVRRYIQRGSREGNGYPTDFAQVLCTMQDNS
jgi:hypothetical protein